jgi:hypothetical protein
VIRWGDDDKEYWNQGCQLVYLSTKNPYLDTFWRALEWKLLVNLMAIKNILAIRYILWPCCIFCGHLVYFVVIWYIFPVLVCCTKKNLETLTRTRRATYIQLPKCVARYQLSLYLLKKLGRSNQQQKYFCLKKRPSFSIFRSAIREPK